jgi:HNH endonuclease
VRSWGESWERCREPDCENRFWHRGSAVPICAEHKARNGVRKRAEKRAKGEDRIIDPAGYVKVVNNEGRYVGEHRVVMEATLGRKLVPGETVHHINGVRADNRPENLELWASSHPSGQRGKDLICPHCGVPYHSEVPK